MNNEYTSPLETVSSGQDYKEVVLKTKNPNTCEHLNASFLHGQETLNCYCNDCKTEISEEDAKHGYEMAHIYKNICPECKHELTTMVEANHPDPNDYPTGVYCENCNYQFTF